MVACMIVRVGELQLGVTLQVAQKRRKRRYRPHAMRLMGVALYPTQLWPIALPRILIFPPFQSSCKYYRG